MEIRVQNDFLSSVGDRVANPPVAAAPAQAPALYGSLRAFRLTRADMPADLKLTGNENEDTLMLLERFHTLVKLHSHDNPAPEILDRLVI